MISLVLTHQLTQRFFNHCTDSFKIEALDLSQKCGMEALSLPLLWASQQSPAEFNSVFSVKFYRDPTSLYGFNLENLHITNEENAKKIIFYAGRDFARDLSYQYFLNLTFDVEDFVVKRIANDGMTLDKAIQQLHSLRINARNLNLPLAHDNFDDEIDDEIDELLNGVLYEDDTHEAGAQSNSDQVDPLTYLFDDELPEATVSEKNEFAELSDYKAWEPNFPDDLFESVPFSNTTHTESNAQTKTMMSETTPMKSSKKLRDITVKKLIEHGDASIKSLLQQLAWMDMLRVQTSNDIHASKLITSKAELPISPMNERQLLQAIFGCPKVIAAFAKEFNIPTFMLEFPEGIAEERVSLLERADKRTFQSKTGDMNVSWYSVAETRTSSLLLGQQVSKILCYLCVEDDKGKIIFQPSNLRELQACLKLPISLKNKTSSSNIFNQFVQQNIIRADWDHQHKYQKIKSIKKQLSDQVIGQSMAINQISDHVSSLFFTPLREHLGIATFFGLSGTGKTQTAITLAELLNSELALNYEFFNIAMEQYNDERDVMKLWGSGSQYVDSAVGVLTQAVMHNPRQVILFDEIEKAHPEVVQSLLSLIATGKGNDRTIERTIDFSQCLFIFTTNLGSNLLEKASQDMILDAKQLLTDKKEQQTRPFSPEMVNRLSAGNIVMFNKLATKDLIKIAQSITEQVHPLDSFNWNGQALDIVVRTLGHDLSPRSLQRQQDQVLGKITNALIEQVEEENFNSLKNISIGIETPKFQQRPKMCLLSNRRWSKNVCDFKNLEIIPVETLEDVKQAIKSNPDITLIDESSLSVDNKLMSRALASFDKQLIMSVGFSSAESNLKELCNATVLHEYISTDKRASEQSLVEILASASRRYQLIEQAEEALTRNLQVAYQIELQTEGDKTAVLLNHFTYQQSIHLADLELPFAQIEAKPTGSFEDIVGLVDTKKRLKLILNWLQNDDLRLDAGVDIPKGYLFSGRPGTGKTQMARSLAGEAQARFINVNAADMLVGNPIKNINDLFNYAKRVAPSIVFIDEIDSIAIDRRQNNGEYACIVNTLLTAMDGFSTTEKPVFVLAATNNPQQLDPALMRPGRLERVIHFAPPNLDTRLQFLHHLLQDKVTEADTEQMLHIATLTAGFTVADLKQLINEVMYQAMEEKRTWAISDIKTQLNNMQFGKIQSSVVISNENRRKTAYHEAGHLVAAKVLNPEVIAEFASIEPTESANGMVVFTENDLHQRTGLTKRKIKHQIQIALAGLAAEHLLGLVGDDAQTGAVQDRKVATQIAKAAILKLGLSDDFGLMIPEVMTIDPQVLNREVNKWLSTEFNNVKELLVEHKTLLDFFSEALLKKGRLEKDEIDFAIQKFMDSGQLKFAA
jgi:cell division protease FtsH